MLLVVKTVMTPSNPFTTAGLTVVVAGVGVLIAWLAYNLSKRQERAEKAAAEAARIQREADQAAILSRVGDAIFGTTVGNTVLPGLWPTVVGDGNGNKGIKGQVVDIAAKQESIADQVEAVQVSADNAKAMAATAAAKAADGVITLGHAVASFDEHIAADEQIHHEQAEQLSTIAEGVHAANLKVERSARRTALIETRLGIEPAAVLEGVGDELRDVPPPIADSG